MNRYKPRTQFVLERLRETKWEDRERIAKLVALEGYARNRGSIHPNRRQSYYRLRQEFPVEWECILRELEEGVPTPVAEYHRQRAEYEAERQRHREEQLRFIRKEKEKEARLEAERRRQWIKMGGHA